MQYYIWSVAPLTHTYTKKYCSKTHCTHDLLHGKETATDEENQIMFLHVQDFIVKSKRFV